MDSDYALPPLAGEEESQTRTGYLQMTRTATYGFWLALPLVLLYEVLIRWVNRGMEGAGVRISSEVWMKDVLMQTPVTPWLQRQLAAIGLSPESGWTAIVLSVLVVLLIGIGIYFWDRKKKVRVKAGYCLGVVLESAIYGVLFAYAAGFLTGTVVSTGAMALLGQEAVELSLFHELVLSLGAGIYEELLFRVLVTGGLFVLLKFFLPRVASYLIAAVVGALVFSAIHYMGPMGDSFRMASFTYRAIGGLLLNGIFLLRGFGAAAWTHALYDVYVFSGLFSVLDDALA